MALRDPIAVYNAANNLEANLVRDSEFQRELETMRSLCRKLLDERKLVA